MISNQFESDYDLVAAQSGLPLDQIDSVVRSRVFDPAFYLAAYPDIAKAGIDPLVHYLISGRLERRKASATFDPQAYFDANPEVAASGMEPFLHYVLIGRAAGAPLFPIEPFCERIALQPEDIDDLEDLGYPRQLLTQAAQAPSFFDDLRMMEESSLFDKQFYRTHVPAITTKINPTAHYLIWGGHRYLDPSENFSSAEYLLLNPDVKAAAANPLSHYLASGRNEQRKLRLSEVVGQPTLERDIPFALRPSEEAELEHMRGTAYLSRYGLTLEKNSSLSFYAYAIGDLAVKTPRLQIDALSPDVSIVISTDYQLPALVNCLESVSEQSSEYSAEVIIIDNTSFPEAQVRQVEAIPWVRYVRNEGEDRNSSRLLAASVARGRFLVFLNANTRVVRNWLEELVGSFSLFPRAASISSKLVYVDRSLEHVRGIDGRDSSHGNLERNADIWQPQYCFARRIDQSSEIAMAIPAEIFKEIGAAANSSNSRQRRGRSRIATVGRRI